METIPTDVLKLIMGCVDPEMQIVTQLVCKRWLKLYHAMNMTMSSTDELQTLNIGIAIYCCRNGYLGIIKYLHLPLDVFALSAAAKRNDVAIFEYAKPKWQKLFSSSIVQRPAVEAGHVDVLKFICEDINGHDDYMALTAVSKGHLETVKVLYSRGCPSRTNLLAYVAKNGKLEILKWLAETRGFNASDGEALLCAVVDGHRDIILWIREWYSRHDKSDLSVDIEKRICSHVNDLDTLKWLRDNNFAWDITTLYEACYENKNDIYEWAVLNGCPSDIHEGFDDDIVKWVAEGYPTRGQIGRHDTTKVIWW